MIDQCPKCLGDNLTYRWSQPSIHGGMAYDVYQCEDCGELTQAEDVPAEYTTLLDSYSGDIRPDCGEGLNW